MQRKRKVGDNHVGRQDSSTSSDMATLSGPGLETAFKKHFESRFKPLVGRSEKHMSIDIAPVSASDSSESLEWNGLSSDGENDKPLVVEYSAVKTAGGSSSKDSKVFMTSKPPRPGWTHSTATPKSDSRGNNDDADVQNDLALQRLIRESHILDASATSKNSNRKEKIVDSRLQSLGAKSSMLRQDTMPMAHRKGIAVKAKNRESKRRKEAAENGIVLERASKMKAPAKKRDRGIGGAAVGKFQGGTLRLSERDVMTIRGPRRAGVRVGRGKKR